MKTHIVHNTVNKDQWSIILEIMDSLCPVYRTRQWIVREDRICSGSPCSLCLDCSPLSRSSSMFLSEKLLKSGMTKISTWGSQQKQDPEGKQQSSRWNNRKQLLNIPHMQCFWVTEMLDPLNNLEGGHMKQTRWITKASVYFVIDSVWELFGMPAYISLTRMPQLNLQQFSYSQRPRFKSWSRTWLY